MMNQDFNHHHHSNELAPLKIVLALMSVTSAWAGPYAPAAGISGTDAVATSDTRIYGWATSVVSYESGEDVSPMWRDTSKALGKAEGNSFDVLSLGRGGQITLTFDEPIQDGPGPDFVIFENGFSNEFLELAFVEVSSNGADFHRFPNRSLTSLPVGAFGTLDPTHIDGLAGKYRQGFGAPFDLQTLAGVSGLNLQAVTHVRIIDVVGGSDADSVGQVIYDPFPTLESAGFDLDGVAVLKSIDTKIQILEVRIAQTFFQLTWASQATGRYRIFSKNSLQDVEWLMAAEILATGLTTTFQETLGERKFYRIEQIP